MKLEATLYDHWPGGVNILMSVGEHFSRVYIYMRKKMKRHGKQFLVDKFRHCVMWVDYQRPTNTPLSIFDITAGICLNGLGAAV